LAIVVVTLWSSHSLSPTQNKKSLSSSDLRSLRDLWLLLFGGDCDLARAGEITESIQRDFASLASLEVIVGGQTEGVERVGPAHPGARLPVVRFVVRRPHRRDRQPEVRRHPDHDRFV
jgi:hypothetical protein